MVANSIISIILNKYKELCQRYPHAASFSASKKGNSFYLIQKRKDLPAIQIRLSNHGTCLKTWTDREELSNSTRLEDPSTCINISIVFIDNGTDITKDCKTMPNCDNCKITPCIPQTFKGQNELGTPFQVMQYVYDSSKIKSRYLNGLTRAIMMARVKGKYNDPLEKLQRAAHLKVLDSRANLPKPKVAKYERNNNKTNENKTMKKNVIRLNESQLKKIIAESVKKVLREDEMPTVSYPSKFGDMGTHYTQTIKIGLTPEDLDALNSKLVDMANGYDEPDENGLIQSAPMLNGHEMVSKNLRSTLHFGKNYLKLSQLYALSELLNWKEYKRVKMDRNTVLLIVEI